MTENPDFFVVIGPVSVDGMTATQPDIIHGFPMPTAVAGFGYKIALEVSSRIQDAVKHCGTAVIVHEHSVMESHAKHPAPSRDGTKGAPIVDEMRGRGIMTFVIGLQSQAATHEELVLEQAKVEEAAMAMLPGMMFGGGKVFPTGKNNVRCLNTEGVGSHFSQSRPGYVLMDRGDLLEEHRKLHGGDMLDAMLDIMELKSEMEQDGKTRKYARRYPGWLVPVTAGFQAIEHPRVRKGTRVDDGVTKHAYVESLYSVGEYRSLRSLVRSREDNAFEGAFWRHMHDQNTETFYVSAN